MARVATDTVPLRTISACNEALAADAQNAGAWHALGMLQFSAGNLPGAEASVRKSTELCPSEYIYLANLAAVLGVGGRHDEAVLLLQRALAIKPGYLNGLNNLGTAMEKLDRPEEAAIAFRQSLSIKEDQAQTHQLLGNVLARMSRPNEAALAYRRSADLQPKNRQAWAGLGNMLAAQGLVSEAIDAFSQLVKLPDATPEEQSDLVMYVQYDAHSSPETRFKIARDYASRFADPLTATANVDRFRRDRVLDPRRRLRIGYVSPEFRSHPVGRLIEPPLAEHDRNAFEIFCYSDVRQPDEITEQLRGLADQWRQTASLDHPALAATIYDDRIDILIDLTGHFAGSRLPAFGYKPAPIQMTGFGYCGTTGLRAIDYRITDAHSDPPGMTERFHSESLLRMPDCCWCYRPPLQSVDPGPAPSEASGRITFANLNNQVKTTEMMAAAWASVLRQFPTGRLLLLTPRGTERQATSRLVRHGTAPQQVIPVAPGTRQSYFERFREIDIALDPFPFNGDNTTCDALWMGVPVVSLVGDSFASRRGLSHLRNVGLGDLAVATVAEYERVAVDLANDHARRARLRRTLRDTLRACPLGNGPAFVQQLEAGYRQAWTRFCDGGQASH